MKKLFAVPVIVGGLAAGLGLASAPAEAHCDSVDGPVATAAVHALDAQNVNLVLPYAPAAAEPELTAAFNQALAVRAQSAEGRALADRYFMETAVRLHRAGENAPYDGLKPADTDHGPAIPAAEQAIAAGTTEKLLALLSAATKEGVEARFAHVLHAKALPAAPTAPSDVPAARERVKAELEFVTYSQGIYAATRGGTHAE